MFPRNNRTIRCLLTLAVTASLCAVAEDAPREPKALEALARVAISTVLSHVLDTPATIDAVHWDKDQGFLELTGLRILNPKGFEADNALAAESVRVEADPRQLFAPEPVLRLLQVRGVTVNAETRLPLGSNLKRLMDNAKRLQSGQRPQPGRAQKKIRIERGVLDGCTVNLATTVLGQTTTEHKQLAPIEMSFGGPDGGGVPVDQAMVQFLGKLLDDLGILNEDSAPRKLVDLLGR